MMRMNALLLALSLIVSGCIGANADSPVDQSLVLPAEQLGRAFGIISSHVRPAVVSVFSEKTIKYRIPIRPGAYNEYKIPQIGAGSGMLLDHQGNILTNYHLVQNVDEIQVQFEDQKKWKAKLIGKDERTDVAVIRIQGKEIEKYPIVDLGDSDRVKVGDLVIAIGAPFGLAQTVTHGIISAKGRAEVGLVEFEDFLQTDAPINPGNSGGPLVNTRGEIIGMNSAIVSAIGQSNGVGFAIPINMIKTMLPSLTKGEKINRGELGVSVQKITEDLAHFFSLDEVKGVIVSQVHLNSPAEKAGIMVEDVIILYGGKKINDVRSLRNFVAETLPDTKIKVELIRNKKNLTVNVTIGKQFEESLERNDQKKEMGETKDRLGITVVTLNKNLAEEYQTSQSSGVIVVDFDEGSPASLAGLREGDVIVQMNHQNIKSADDFKKVLLMNKTDPLLLLIKRQEGAMFLSVRFE